MYVTIGIKIEDDAKTGVINAMSAMQNMGTRGEYTDHNQLFLPLVEIPEIDYLGNLKIAIDIINAFQFEITLDKIDHNGAIYWIEVKNSDYFISYWRYLNERLRYAAINTKKRNRNHVPHIIVSRKTVIPRKSIMPPVENLSMTVKKVSVMKTEIKNEAPYYTELFSKLLAPKKEKA